MHNKYLKWSSVLETKTEIKNFCLVKYLLPTLLISLPTFSGSHHSENEVNPSDDLDYRHHNYKEMRQVCFSLGTLSVYSTMQHFNLASLAVCQNLQKQ